MKAFLQRVDQPEHVQAVEAQILDETRIETDVLRLQPSVSADQIPKELLYIAVHLRLPDELSHR